MAKPRKPKAESEATSIVAPSVRVFTEWNPAKIRAAKTSAESGSLTQAVAVCEWLLTDDKVDGALDARCDALFGLIPGFEPSGDRRRSNRAVKALEAGEDFWAAYPEHELRLMLRWALLLGCSLHRHGWKEHEDHGGRLLPNPSFYHPQTLRYDFAKGTWSVRTRDNRELPVTPGDGEWILHTPFGVSRPWAHGKWRSLARWVLLKHYAVLDWARHGEKASTLVATSEKDTTQKQRQELAEDLQASGSDRVVALAAGFDLKLVEVSANTRQIYDAQIEAADKAITILLRGGNLTSDVSENGARSAAETQAKQNELPKLRFDSEAIATTLHDQSLVWWAEFNFGDSKLAPWPVWPTEPETDKGERAKTVKTLFEGLKLADELGFEIDTDELIEDFGLDFITGRGEPKPKQPAPAGQKPPAPGKGDDEADEDEQARAGTPRAEQRGGFVAKLASGAPASENRGFTAGQVYVDGVVDSAAAAASEALEPTLKDIAAAIEASTSYEDLRERLRALYRQSKTDQELSELLYRAMLLGEMAGRRAVTQDA